MTETRTGPLGQAATAGDDGSDDATLIGQSVHAPERFAVLFDRHAPAIHRYAARRLGGDRADDVVAEAFLVAFTRRGDYDLTQADARPWLYGIATNLIRRHRRDEIRLFRAIARSAPGPPAEPIADQVAGRVSAASMRRSLAAALAGLSGPQRDVLLLVASGLSVQETAAALGVPPGTVASRLARARRKVRAALGEASPVSDLEE